MQSVVFQKKLNNAELGKAGVHDCYIREDVGFTFNEFNFVQSEYMTFWCPKNSKTYNGIHYEIFPHESRIAGLGGFFSDFNVTPADTVILTGNISNEKKEYLIDVKKEENVIVLTTNKKGFEILNEEKLNLMNDNTTFNNKPFKIELVLQAKKRADSPNLTNYYDIIVNDESFNPEIGKVFEIKIEQNRAIFRRRDTWKKDIFNIGD